MKRLSRTLTVCLMLSFATHSLADSVRSQPDDVIPVTPPVRIDTPIVTVKKQDARLWNLQDADILSVINEVALETGKNFIIDPRVNGKITLISSKAIKPNEVYDVFLSVLSLLGYSAIPSGDVIKIVPNMESSEYATRVAVKGAPGKGDEVVVRVIPLENVAANQLIPVLRPLLPQWSNITAYTPGNVLIVVGRASNLERIMNIINNVDRAADNNIEIVPLHRASALQVANVLNNLQNAARTNGDTTQVSIAPDERSNSLLLGGNKGARIRLRLLISQLDGPGAGVQGNTEVIYLRYLIAKHFAPILGKIAQNLMGKDGGHDMPVASSQNSSGGSAKTPENMTSIQAEPSTNSLIITAPPTLMRSLTNIVSKLDIRPSQVLVEGILVEIDQDDLKKLGIQWGARLTGDSPGSAGPGFTPFGEGTIGIIPAQQVTAVLSALQLNANINVLSTPSVVVLDNHKAALDVGQDVPVQTGSYVTPGGGGGGNNVGNPFNTTGYRKVALVLEVTPQINLGNSVRLTVKIKNDSLQNPSNPGPSPLINTSQITNSVIINSCDILVIGGLIRNSVTDSVDKIPILGDIPVIGTLFQHKTRQLQKRNLVVFLKPIIMHNQDEANALTHTKYENVRNTQINWPVDLSNPGKQKAENIFPPWKNNIDIPKPFEG